MEDFPSKKNSGTVEISILQYVFKINYFNLPGNFLRMLIKNLLHVAGILRIYFVQYILIFGKILGRVGLDSSVYDLFIRTFTVTPNQNSILP